MFLAKITIPEGTNEVSDDDSCALPEMIALNGKNIMIAEESDFHLWSDCNDGLMDGLDFDKYDFATPLVGGEEFFSWKKEWLEPLSAFDSTKFFCEVSTGNCFLVGE